ncbi:hypothetical protein GCM10009839_24290 [Catenulispora yoronensis]|uniref:Secreted protein n=1 Tax=Catenulispora yoronensis TaxID=450799 RepID=A0ABP5FF61_9ACTN
MGLAAAVAAGAAGCGSEMPKGAQRTPCPSGSPLPGGRGESRDYVDLVRFDGRVYYSPSGVGEGLLADPSKRGSWVGTVQCSQAQHDSNRRTEPEWTDPGSTLVPDGGPLYAVAGVPVACQLVATSADGRLHLYTAQEQYRPANCPP